MTKTCNKCHLEKADSEYHRHSQSKDGLAATCKVCRSTRTDEDRQKERDRDRRRRERGILEPGYLEGERARQRAWDRSPKKLKQMMKPYGMTPEDREKLLSAQGGVCAICRQPPVKRRLCIDHDHKKEYAPGKCRKDAVRGLLCHRCNHTLGWVQDNPILLRLMADYIEAHL